jgi:hypothetical protein
VPELVDDDQGHEDADEGEYGVEESVHELALGSGEVRGRR